MEGRNGLGRIFRYVLGRVTWPSVSEVCVGQVTDMGSDALGKGTSLLLNSYVKHIFFFFFFFFFFFAGCYSSNRSFAASV